MDDDERTILEGLEQAITPLHACCLLGYAEIVQFLIVDGKADPNFLGPNKQNALWYSIMGKQPEITQYLLTNSKVNIDNLDSDERSVRDNVEMQLPGYLSAFDKLISVIEDERRLE